MKIKIQKKPKYKTKNTIAITFIYNKQLSDLTNGIELFNLFKEQGFFPEKYSALSTLRKKRPITFERLNELLSQIWLPIYVNVEDTWILDSIEIYRDTAPKYWGNIYRDYLRTSTVAGVGDAVYQSTIALFVEADTLAGSSLNCLENIIGGLIKYSNADFARIQYYSSYEMWESGCLREPRVTLGSRSLSKNLPDLHNISVWGKSYIELFGKEKIINAPCYKVEELSSGVMWMQLSPDVYNEKGCWTALTDTREKIKAYLNNNAFFDPKLPHDYKYNIPKFDLSDIRKPLKISEESSF